MVKKSKAQLKRLQKRAETRGEVYELPAETEKPKDVTKGRVEAANDQDDSDELAKSKNPDRKADNPKLSAAIQLQKELAAIENNTELKSKERRSAKRKAEAIAVECSGCASAEELLQWYEENGKKTNKNRKNEQDFSKKARRENPYIVFIGQLAYDTTKEELFAHIQKELGKDHKITPENVKIRLLTDAKTKKSRGMAFVEVKDDPELLYSCLKLHNTHLGGRRIRVERSAGGGKNSEARKNKLLQYRQEQEQHMDATVNAMLQEYYKRGEIQDNGEELDDGVIALCKRHSATVVQAALERYVETNGRDMDNPSAYLSFLIGKLATEGVNREQQQHDVKKHTRNDRQSNGNKRPRHKKQSTDFKASSTFAKEGVDMSPSEGGKADLSRIFPSLNRGRGRGRGYM